MKIATWNINSVRLRLPLVLKFIGQCNPDIVALQETKTPDEFFPFKELHEAGYEHIHIHGMKGYNGVAILSRIPFKNPQIHDRAGRQDCRHISVTVCPLSQPSPQRGEGKGGGEFELHNLYIPAGGDIPDPIVNDKFRHKLDFVDEMTEWFAAKYKTGTPLVALGDFNIAPLEHDVWSHKQLLNVVSHTPPETTRLNAMQASLNWVDSTRHFVPEEEKAYTWWSYRNHDWRKSNRGRRLDHIWVTKPLAPALKGHEILTEARDWAQPSDHVPVMVDLAI